MAFKSNSAEHTKRHNGTSEKSNQDNIQQDEPKSLWKRLFLNALTLGFKIANDSDSWEYNEEPHVSRRKAILEKHPEIKKLMGCDPKIAFITSMEVIVQIIACYFIGSYDPGWGFLCIAAYCFGAFLNHSLGSAIHEIGHNLAFGHKYPWANRLLSIFCNLPMAVPLAISYKKYHTDHHRWLGNEENDVDIPTKLESYMFKNPLTKLLWLTIHPIIHGLRPFFKSPRPVTQWELINFVVQVIFDLVIFSVFGFKALVYLVLGTFFGLGCHPLSGHFISEHYLFQGSQATHSYYGPLNIVLFNVGYHVEHHDFPYIPYSRLPQVRKIANEFYKDLPYHTSWLKVLWQFIWHDHMGPKAHMIVYEPNGPSTQQLENKKTH